MRKAGKDQRDKAKNSESLATPSVAGSLFGTQDTKMKDVEFDTPSNT
jgi:hypothetical protein